MLQMLRLRRPAPLAVAALLVGAGLAQPAYAAEPPVTIAAQPPLTVDRVAGSVDYLMREHGVSQAEALRRLELQRTHAELLAPLETRFAGNYAGSWLDQDNGGVLVVAAKRPEEVRRALRNVPDAAHITVVPARRSLVELQAVADRLVARFGIRPGLEPVIDDLAGAVVVPDRAAEGIRAAGGVAALGADAAVTRLASPVPRADMACTIQNCDPPMRGGLKLTVYAHVQSTVVTELCTNGFNVRSTGARYWQWTLTAGHCVDEANENVTQHDSFWVGYYEPTTFTGGSGAYPLDGAIMPYLVLGGINYSFYWLEGLPKNRVFAANLNNSLYPITGSYTYAQIRVGWLVCHTGAASEISTRCGKVTAKDGGIRTNICTRHGDSGGPLYSQVDQKAYAILTGGNDPMGTCDGATSWYSPVSSIFAAATSTSGSNFFVNTS